MQNRHCRANLNCCLRWIQAYQLKPKPNYSQQWSPQEAPLVADSLDNSPEWERDPTLAELRPDMEALEQAMAQSYEDEAQAEPQVAEPDPVVELKDPTLNDMPEITLDVAIQQKIEEATEALQKHDATIAEEEIEDAPKPVSSAQPSAPTEAPQQIPNDIADGISNARSLEDVDDKMAETLFGAEFAALAAEAVANRPPGAGLETELSLVESEPVAPELELLVPEPQEMAAASDTPANDRNAQTDMEREFLEVYGDDALEVSLQSDSPPRGLDLSASQRLATVRALNANKSAKPTSNPGLRNTADSKSVATPQPIEEQISTSITHVRSDIVRSIKHKTDWYSGSCQFALNR